MEKRYQVFVSSTYEDLRVERQAVIESILELGHFPAGMELFPASDDTSWDVIRQVMATTDYYVLIIGGRYGSLVEGISYTEREYELAVELKIPCIVLTHGEPEAIPSGKTDGDPIKKEKLKQFLERVQSAHNRLKWTTPDNLARVASRSLNQEIRTRPRVGWVRSDEVPDGTTLSDIVAYQRRISELEKTLALNEKFAPDGSEALASGKDIFQLKVRASWDVNSHQYSATVYLNRNWDHIFSLIALELLSGCYEATIKASVERHVKVSFGVNSKIFAHSEYTQEDREVCLKFLPEFVTLDEASLRQILIQFRALGLIEISCENVGSERRWELTPYGNFRMNQACALPKGQVSAEVLIDEDDMDDSDPFADE